MNEKRKRGADSFGRITITGGPCNACDHVGGFTIKYAPKSFKLPAFGGMEIDVTKTILKTTDNYLGINCGCYAKFHRQVAHIFDTMSMREKNG